MNNSLDQKDMKLSAATTNDLHTTLLANVGVHIQSGQLYSMHYEHVKAMLYMVR